MQEIGFFSLVSGDTKHQGSPEDSSWTKHKLPESLMEIFKVVLNFESVDEILWCDHSNETSLAVLSHGTIYSI